jgi:hypothetical protein
MPDSPKPIPSLIMIQFLAWVADRPRTYADAMDAWRTSCPRLSVWEDAIIEDLVRIEGNGAGDRTNGGANRDASAVTLTRRGHAVLQKAQSGSESNRGRSTAQREPFLQH